MNKEISKYLEITSKLRKTFSNHLEIIHYPSYGIPRPPENSRAEVLIEVCWLLRRYLAEEMNQPNKGQQESSELLGLNMKGSEVDRRIYEAGGDNQRAQIVEQDAIRPFAQEVRDFSSRFYPMWVQPIWPIGQVSVNTNAVFYAGSSGLEETVTSVSEQIGMSVMVMPFGKDFATARWKQLREAMVCVFDLGFEDGHERASVAYELGIALALGKPIVVIDSIEHPVPFDVHLNPLTLTNNNEAKPLISAAIDIATAWTYERRNSNAILRTLDYIQSKYTRPLQNIYLDQTLKLLIEQASQPDPLEITRTLKTFVDFLNDGSTMLIYPVWLPDYPDTANQRLFHVMPFRPDWADNAMNTTKKACESMGADYIRGDKVSNPNVIQSIWSEICQATHILVDLTDFNANVALELGIAHTLGRQFMMVGQRGTVENLFPMIEKLRCETYKKPEELEDIAKKFLSKNI